MERTATARRARFVTPLLAVLAVGACGDADAPLAPQQDASDTGTGDVGDVDGSGDPDTVPAPDPCPDGDGDGVCDDVDLCPGHDDGLDHDEDGVPNGCDVCLAGDDTVDTDGDGVPDACDVCAGGDDTLDTDGDGVPDACDRCPGFDDRLDTDRDGVPNGCDVCAPGDPDQDGDGVADACDLCPNDANNDEDGDGICGDVDPCIGPNALGDTNGDGYCDATDLCAASTCTAMRTPGVRVQADALRLFGGVDARPLYAALSWPDLAAADRCENGASIWENPVFGLAVFADVLATPASLGVLGGNITWDSVQLRRFDDGGWLTTRTEAVGRVGTDRVVRLRADSWGRVAGGNVPDCPSMDTPVVGRQQARLVWQVDLEGYGSAARVEATGIVQ